MDYSKKIGDLINNSVETQNIIDQSNRYYNSIFDEKYILKDIKKIINDYLDYSKKWEF